MKRFYSRFRVGLMTFAFGLAAVYLWNGMSIALSEIPVDLPLISSDDEVLVVFPTEARYVGYYPDTAIDRTDQIIGTRDLSLYDFGGFAFDCTYEDADKVRACLSKRDAARQFVYDHWTEKRRGYIKVDFPCVDCFPVDHIFIEPDENGRWNIVITLETNGPLSTSHAVNVKFRRASRDEQSGEQPSRMLAFVDESGNEIESF